MPVRTLAAGIGRRPPTRPSALQALLCLAPANWPFNASVGIGSQKPQVTWLDHSADESHSDTLLIRRPACSRPSAAIPSLVGDTASSIRLSNDRASVGSPPDPHPARNCGSHRPGAANHEMFTRLYITPKLGSRRLDKLTVREVQTWLNGLRVPCQCCTQGKDS